MLLPVYCFICASEAYPAEFDQSQVGARLGSRVCAVKLIIGNGVSGDEVTSEGVLVLYSEVEQHISLLDEVGAEDIPPVGSAAKAGQLAIGVLHEGGSYGKGGEVAREKGFEVVDLGGLDPIFMDRFGVRDEILGGRVVEE